jgi:hypothetical protein
MLRQFRNTDPPHLTRIWNRHYEACNAAVAVAPGAFDACVLSKPFFRAKDLWLYEYDGHPVGFIHLGFDCQDEASHLNFDKPLISALCVEPHPHEENIADQLIDRALQLLRRAGNFDSPSFNGSKPEGVSDFSSLPSSPSSAVDSPSLADRFVPNQNTQVAIIGSPNRYAFYLGIAPGDGLMGVVARDRRLQQWLSRHGFEPTRPTECWEVALNTFRPPMDRSQFSLRRSMSVVRSLDEQHRSWWDAVVLGHTEQIRFQILPHQSSNVAESASFWFIDTTFAGISSNVVRLWMIDFPDDVEGRDRMTYLLSEAFRQLHSERFTAVRAIATPDQASSVAIFRRLGMKSIEPGLVFERKLTVT